MTKGTVLTTAHAKRNLPAKIARETKMNAKNLKVEIHVANLQILTASILISRWRRKLTLVPV